jgi:diacylglycerol kinase
LETAVIPEKRPGWFSRLSFHPDVKATLSTNPDGYSPITSKSRIASFRYALAGWLFMLRYQKNVRIQAAASILVFTVGLWLTLTPVEWAILILIITINWMTEFLNAAVEAVVNLASPTIHPMARVAKDVAAAATLLAAVAAAIIGGLILGPPLLERLVPLIARALRLAP